MAHFLSNNSRAHVTNVANTATGALTVKTSKQTTKSKALTAKLQAKVNNSRANATIVVSMTTGKNSAASAYQKWLVGKYVVWGKPKDRLGPVEIAAWSQT